MKQNKVRQGKKITYSSQRRQDKPTGEEETQQESKESEAHLLTIIGISQNYQDKVFPLKIFIAQLGDPR